MFRRPLTRVVPALAVAATCFYLFSPFDLLLRHRGYASVHGYAYTAPSFDWAAFPQRYPVPPDEMARLPTNPPHALPRVQHASLADDDATTGPGSLMRRRRDSVVQAFYKSWIAYRQRAWGWDELMPLSGGRKNPFGGIGATLVDALDSLWIMGLHTEFRAAVEAVALLDYNDTPDASLNLFETTIRHLGGLLAAYDLSGEPVLLRKATDLGNMLYAAFDTPNRLPGFWFHFADARAGAQVAGTADASAAPTSLALEFCRLAQLTGDNRFYDAVDRVTRFLERTQNETALPGLWPRQLNFRGQSATDALFTLGAQADSLYEYLPKMAALLATGPAGDGARYEALARRALAVAEEELLFRPMAPGGEDVLFAGDAFVARGGAVSLKPEGQHLGCFAGGMYALAGRLFGEERLVGVGARLARGCAWGYAAFPTGILPEIFGLVPCETREEACAWDEDEWLRFVAGAGETMPEGFTHARDSRYILRPEAIESVFLLYRMTGERVWQDLAWDMFSAIRQATETEYAFAAIADVNTQGEPIQVDSMESFWLAETLKYFYLIFSPPDVISLDDYVFNTEAHPLKRPKPKE